ncbi:hypothetical protein DT076_16855 [Desertihabitans brevis]|uniref:Uncharacterized protein n=1 Tax=Desertihabitans brevis TaxID=2268447 RepID=A0A367YQZ3_9ACTN|nr:hypothetical protein [Desertihabitans brevis]RCK68316.1 hypothetical protein DT076_16855 [Desertihabitans brevis]
MTKWDEEKAERLRQLDAQKAAGKIDQADWEVRRQNVLAEKAPQGFLTRLGIAVMVVVGGLLLIALVVNLLELSP